MAFSPDLAGTFADQASWLEQVGDVAFSIENLYLSDVAACSFILFR